MLARTHPYFLFYQAMLGHLLLFKDSGTESIEITTTVSQIVAHGVHVEAKVEEKGLRLSKLEMVSRVKNIGNRC